MRHALCVLTLFSFGLLGGCSSDPVPLEQAAASPRPAPTEAQASSEPEVPGSDVEVYDVVCGCSLSEVGHCGEYAQVNGEFLPIEGDLGLGPMPFCGKAGLRAKIKGEVTDGRLMATSLELVE
jgi:hypothetical protein